MRKLSVTLTMMVVVGMVLLGAVGRVFAGQPGDVEIQVSKTADTNDDLVRLGGTTVCRARLTSPAPNDVNIMLTTTNSRLALDLGTATYSLILPKNGDWSYDFFIYGSDKSTAKNDVKIEAHKDTATGALMGDKSVTVYWLDGSMTVTAGSYYGFSSNNYMPVGGPGVNFSATGTIKPTGVDCSITDYKDYDVGMIQNIISSQTKTFYKEPSYAFFTALPLGTKAYIYPVLELTTTSSGGNDTNESVAPLYDQPGRSTTIDQNSVQSLCSGAPATSNDAPQTKPHLMDMEDLDGNPAGQVLYSKVDDAEFNMSFRIWSIAYHPNGLGAVHIPLSETTWSGDVDSRNGSQRAVPGGSEEKVSFTPRVLEPAVHNEVPVLAGTPIIVEK